MIPNRGPFPTEQMPSVQSPAAYADPTAPEGGGNEGEEVEGATSLSQRAALSPKRTCHGASPAMMPVASPSALVEKGNAATAVAEGDPLIGLDAMAKKAARRSERRLAELGGKATLPTFVGVSTGVIDEVKKRRGYTLDKGPKAAATVATTAEATSRVAEIDSLIQPMLACGSEDAAVDVLGNAMSEHSDCPATQRYCNTELFDLARRDDPRILALLGQRRSLEAIVRGAEGCESDAVVQEMACRLLWLLAVDVKLRAVIVLAGGCANAVRVLVRHRDNEDAVTAALGCIKPLSVDFYGGGGSALERKDAGRAVALAMAAHLSNPKIQTEGCSVLSNLAVDIKNQQVAIATKEEVMAILHAMATHPTVKSVQKQACFALKHLAFAARNAEALAEAELPTKQLIEAAMQSFPDVCKRDAKVALKRLAKGSKNKKSSFSSSSSNSLRRTSGKGRRDSTASASTATTASVSTVTSQSSASSSSSSNAIERALNLSPFRCSGSQHQLPSTGRAHRDHLHQYQSQSPTMGVLETIQERNTDNTSLHIQHLQNLERAYQRSLQGSVGASGGSSLSASPNFLTASSPNPPGESTGLTDELFKNAVRSGQKGEYSAAREQFEIVLKMKTSLYGPGAINSDLVNVLNCIGYVCALAGDTSLAMRRYKQSLDMQQRLLNGVTADEDLANTLSSIGVLYMKIRDLGTAERFLTSAMQLKQSISHTKNIANNLSVSRELESLGDLECLKGRLDEAETLYRLAASCYSSTDCSLAAGSVPTSAAAPGLEVPLAGITSKLGMMAGARGDHASAKNLIEASLDAKRCAYGPGAQNADLAEALCAMGYADAASGDVVEATGRYEESLDMQRRVPGDGGRLRSANLARTLTSLGMLCINRGLRGAARSYLEEALDVKLSLLGGKDESEEASREFLDMLQILGEACDCDEDAEIYFEEALEHANVLLCYEQALEHASLESNFNMRMFNLQVKVADLLFELGLIVMRRGEFESAWERCNKAHEIYQNLRNAVNWNPALNARLIRVLNNTGYICAIIGDYSSAVDKYDLSLKLQQNITEPGTVTIEMAHTNNSLGVLYFKQGAHIMAENHFVESLSIKLQTYGPDSQCNPSIADALRNLGEVCMARKKYEQAETYFEEAFSVYNTFSDDDDYDGMDTRAEISDIYSKLGTLAGLRGDVFSAQEHFETALEIKRDMYEPDEANLDLVGALSALGYTYAVIGNFDLALQKYEESLKLLQCIYGLDSECEEITNTTRSLNLLKRVAYMLCPR